MYLSNKVYKETCCFFLMPEPSSEVKPKLWWLPHHVYLAPYIKVTKN